MQKPSASRQHTRSPPAYLLASIPPERILVCPDCSLPRSFAQSGRNVILRQRCLHSLSIPVLRPRGLSVPSLVLALCPAGKAECELTEMITHIHMCVVRRGTGCRNETAAGTANISPPPSFFDFAYSTQRHADCVTESGPALLYDNLVFVFAQMLSPSATFCALSGTTTA